MLDRRQKALQRNYFRLMERLHKSTQAWTSKLTGVQHWKPETGFDVFVFDPNNQGETYVLLRRWNEDNKHADEIIKKHKTGHTDPASAIQATKDWIAAQWDTLKNFEADEKEPKADLPEKPKEAEETKAESVPVASLESEIKDAMDEVSEEELCRFENFLDDGVQTDDDKDEAWRKPWLRRLNAQLEEMGKDYSQYERSMQQRRDKAMEKSLKNIFEKIEKVKKEIKNA